MLKLYNTLSRKLEEFKPLKSGEVKIYSCGPTVYWNQHIGHMYAYVQWDSLVRYLKYLGYKVKWVMNITDVGHMTSDEDAGEDKMEKGARREKLTVWQLADKYIGQFLESLDLLNIQKPDVLCRATDYIQEQIDLIKKIEASGFTYQTKIGLVFDTSKFPEYAKFAKLNLEKQYTGTRVDVDPEKKQPWDFYLWKFDSAPHGLPRRQMNWWFQGQFTGQPLVKPPQGLKEKAEGLKKWKKAPIEDRQTIGFPGWHIECTAMSVRYLGQRFDIHTGGKEHIPVHHTNEIAQGFGAFGLQTANFWLHNDWLVLKGEKMSKSLGNFVLATDFLKKGIEPLAFRYLILTSHYRQGLNFTWEALKASSVALNSLREQIINYKLLTTNRKRTSLSIEKLQKIEGFRKRFLQAINNDLAIPEALALMWEIIKSNIPPQDKSELLLDFDQIFGLKLSEVKEKKIMIPVRVKELLKKREKLRQRGKWSKADKIRKEVERLGFITEDTKKGAKLREKTE